MRMSCNGCRVLRKGCSDDCSLRPCLRWIKTPEAQANATVFLAKFYGRAGLINLLNAGPDHLRHEIFKSLLYEACGRIIDPIHGAVGLIWSGNWDRCKAAVEAVLAGAPIVKVSITDDAAAEEHPIIPLKGCDIRHFAKLSNGLNTNNYNYNNNSNSNSNIHRVRASRNRFKRASGKAGLVDTQLAAHDVNMSLPSKFSITGWEFDGSDNTNDEAGDADGGLRLRRAPSHDSFSVETVEPTLVNPVEQGRCVKSENHHLDVAAEEDADLLLDLTLGCYPVRRT